MGDFLFGEEPEQMMHVYGELPGLSELGQQLWPALGGWLGAWTTGVGQQFPGAQQAQQLWAASGAPATAARGRLGEMLSPGWVGETPPGLEMMEAARRGQMEQDLEDMRGNLRMEFGGRGQTFSSPMLGQMARQEMAARQGLADWLGQQRFGAYQQRLGMMPQLMGMAMDQPYKAAGLIGQRGDAMINALLAYLSEAKGDPFVTQSGGSPGLLDYAADVASSYYPGAGAK